MQPPRWTRFGTASLALLVAACGPPDAGPPGSQRTAETAGSQPTAETPGSRETGEAAARAEVRAELEAYYVDFSARDWPAFSDHFWPGGTITTVWRPPEEDRERVVVTSIPEFVARAPQGPGSREIFEEELLGADVRVTGDLAQAWARYSARFGDPGEVAEWQGTDAFTLMKHDGRWRIVSLVFTADG